jgi:hypothetical protein
VSPSPLPSTLPLLWYRGRSGVLLAYDGLAGGQTGRHHSSHRDSSGISCVLVGTRKQPSTEDVLCPSPSPPSREPTRSLSIRWEGCGARWATTHDKSAKGPRMLLLKLVDERRARRSANSCIYFPGLGVGVSGSSRVLTPGHHIGYRLDTGWINAARFR